MRYLSKNLMECRGIYFKTILKQKICFTGNKYSLVRTLFQLGADEVLKFYWFVDFFKSTILKTDMKNHKCLESQWPLCFSVIKSSFVCHMLIMLHYRLLEPLEWIRRLKNLVRSLTKINKDNLTYKLFCTCIICRLSFIT